MVGSCSSHWVSFKGCDLPPCPRCNHYQKELLMKDQTIRELKEKLRLIHQMSTSSSDEQTQTGITSVNTGYASSLTESIGIPCKGEKTCDRELMSEAVDLSMNTKSVSSSGGEVNVTIQEIIDRAVEYGQKYWNEEL